MSIFGSSIAAATYKNMTACRVDEAKAARLVNEYGADGAISEGYVSRLVRAYYKKSRKMAAADKAEVDTEAATARVLAAFGVE